MIQRQLASSSSGGNNIWVLGVVLVIIGSLGNNFGNNLVSLSHKMDADKQAEEEKLASDKKDNNSDDNNNDIKKIENSSNQIDDNRNDNDNNNQIDNIEKGVTNATLLANENESTAIKYKFSAAYYRTVGTIIFVICNLCTFAAFGFAAQSLLASLESIQFVSNLFFTRYVFNEPITYRMMIATLGIVVGNTLVVIFSEHSAILFTSKMIINLYETNTPYHAYLCIGGALFMTFHFISVKYYNSRVNQKILLWKHSFVEPFSYAISSSIIGTQAVLMGKCMSLLIQVSGRAGTDGYINEFEIAPIWVILVVWLLMVTYWLRRLDGALALYPPMFIIPVMQVFFIVFAIICGGLFFEEFVYMDGGQIAGFVIGVLMILLGVYLLAPTDAEVIKVDDIKNIEANEVLQVDTTSPVVEKVKNEKYGFSTIASSKVAPITSDVDLDEATAKKAKRKVVNRPSDPQIISIQATNSDSISNSNLQ